MIKTLELNGYWKFLIDREDKGMEECWNNSMPQNADDIWVPSCWNEAKEEWFHYEGVAWYFRKFRYTQDKDISREVLFFGGVNYKCDVWLNKTHVRSHIGGFTPFECDVTELLRTDNENLLVVRVDGTMDKMTVPPIGVDWFNYEGIFRNVQLNCTGEKWFEDVTVTTKISGDCQVKASIGNFSDAGASRLEITIEDPEENRVVFRSSEIIDGSSHDFEAKITDPKLWSPDSPFLYRFSLVLTKDKRVMDIWEHKIGIREFATDGRDILINGKKIMLKGYSKHEEYLMFGRTFVEEIVRKDYEICKSGGANFLRLCHYPHDLREYEIASEMGFVVIAEVPNVNFRKEHFENQEVLDNAISQAQEMIKYYKNETCIMFWSLFIECRTDEEAAVAFVPEYAGMVKKLDPTRFTIHASVIPMEDKTYNCFDIVGVNYWSGWYYGETVEAGGEMLDKIAQRYPDKPIVMTSGGWEGIYGYHSHMKGEKWSEEEQARYLEEMLMMYQSKDYIAGEIIWTFSDFRVSPWIISGDARWILRPMELNHKGVLDSFRRPKLSYYKVKEVFGK